MSLYYNLAMILDKRAFLMCLLTVVIFISLLFLQVETFEDSGEPIPILNLVLYSSDGGGPYDRMQKMTRDYYKKFSFVKTYYYCFK